MKYIFIFLMSQSYLEKKWKGRDTVERIDNPFYDSPFIQNPAIMSGIYNNLCVKESEFVSFV